MSEYSCQNDHRDYCKSCHSAYFRDNFAHWTSGDSRIDKLIQNSQLNANYQWKFIEWIEYTNLENIEFVAHGGFGSVYKAIWKNCSIDTWDNNRNYNKFELQRNNNFEVAVKKFRNVIQVSSEFLNEVNRFYYYYEV